MRQGLSTCTLRKRDREKGKDAGFGGKSSTTLTFKNAAGDIRHGKSQGTWLILRGGKTELCYAKVGPGGGNTTVERGGKRQFVSLKKKRSIVFQCKENRVGLKKHRKNQL